MDAFTRRIAITHLGGTLGHRLTQLLPGAHRHLIGLVGTPAVDLQLLDPVTGHLVEEGQGLGRRIVGTTHQRAAVGAAIAAPADAILGALATGRRHQIALVVAEYTIKQHRNPAPVSLVNQGSGLLQGAEAGIDAKEVGGKVAGAIEPIAGVILPGHRRGFEDGRQPDGIYPQLLYVVQAADHPLQVPLMMARTITDAGSGPGIAIHKGLHHDLVDAQPALGIAVAPVAGKVVVGSLRRLADAHLGPTADLCHCLARRHPLTAARSQHQRPYGAEPPAR